MNESFDDTAQNLAEIIDAIMVEECSRDRRIELIRHHIRRALAVGFKAGLAKVSNRVCEFARK
jgi:hypothetical protein